MGISNLISKINFTKEKKNFYSKISGIKFKTTKFKEWEYLKPFIKQNSEHLKKLESICIQYTPNSKSKSNEILSDITKYANSLNGDLKKLENIDSLTIEDLTRFQSNSEGFCKVCKKISEEKFSHKFGEVLDYAPIKKVFERFGKEIFQFEKSVENIFVISEVEGIISQIESTLKEQKFDSKIEKTIYLPDSDKYTKLKIEIDLSSFKKDDQGRNEYLRKKLSEVNKKIKLLNPDATKKISDFLSKISGLKVYKSEEIPKIGIDKINLEASKSIIKDAEEMVKNKHFNKDINREVFKINSESHKLDHIEITTNFFKFKSEKGKAEHLKQVLSSANDEYLKDYKESHKIIDEFLKSKLDQKFIDSLPDELEECFICHKKMDLSKEEDIAKLKCGHTFHKGCLDKKDKVCPICRKPL